MPGQKTIQQGKNTGEWNPYKLALTSYNKELRKSKRASWRKHCEEINSLPEAVRLQKALRRDYRNPIGTLKRPDGSYTQHPGETSRLLLDTHFPGCKAGYCRPELGAPTPTSGREQSLATKLTTVERVQWALSTFSPYKSPGPDGIYPCLLQHGIRHIAPVLSKLYRASLLLGYIPSRWSEVKVVFLPKMGKPEQLPTSFRPISLSSFLLKGMEKILDQHIREVYLKERPLNKDQFAYQPGKSTETAIHSLTSKIEKALESKNIALCAFIDISGAFDNTSHKAIQDALLRKGVSPIINQWVLSMLKTRNISLELGGTIESITATRGCPQGVYSLPFCGLWLQTNFFSH